MKLYTTCGIATVFVATFVLIVDDPPRKYSQVIGKESLQGQNEPSEPQNWRTVLRIGDPHRDWSVQWSRTGGLIDVPSLVDGNGVATKCAPRPFCPQIAIWYTPSYVRAFSLPAGISPGNYTIQPGGQVVTVAGPRLSRPTTRLQPGATIDQLTAALTQGDVELAPGLYVFSRAVPLVGNRVITGYGARVRREPNGDYAERLFLPADMVTIEGVTFDVPGYLFHRPDVGGANMVIRDCTLIGGSLGEWGRPNLLVERCHFNRSAANQITDKVCFHQCEFRGLASSGHAWSSWGGKNIVAAECRWDGTDRGLVFQTKRGDISESLIINNLFRSIAQNNAGSEVITVERTQGTDVGTFTNNLILHTRIRDCVGPGIQFYSAECRRNRVIDALIDVDGVGIELEGQTKPQTDNEFTDVETTGMIWLGPMATGNTFRSLAVFGGGGRRGNVFRSDPTWYAHTKRPAVYATGPQAGTNRVYGLTATRLDGVAASSGVIILP